MKAIVLLSGGLDSATVLGLALSRHKEVVALHVSYGQRHLRERTSAEQLAEHYRVKLVKAELFMPILGSALTDPSVDVPMGGDTVGIPVTYVPARNTFLLGLAASVAEGVGASTIYVGFNVLDYSGYPDCRPEFIYAMNQALMSGMKVPAQIVAPLIQLKKTEIIALANKLGVPLQLSWSCYQGGETPCGKCDSCRIRAAAFTELKQVDATVEGWG